MAFQRYLRVKRLHRFTLRMFFGPMVMTFFIVMFIMLMQFLWKYIDDLVGKGLEVGIILELLLYASAGLMPMAMPLAVLLASLMTMGNLGEHNELLAMKAAGVSLPRIMMPMAVVTLLITVGAFLWADHVVPVATLKLRTMIGSVQDQRPELVIRPGAIYNDISGYSIRVGARQKGSSKMEDIMIYDHSENQGNISVTRAESGYITIAPSKTYIVLDLHHGTMYEESDRDALTGDKPTYAARSGSYARQRVVKALKGYAFQLQKEDQFGSSFRVMNTSQLAQTTDSLTAGMAADARNEYERLESGALMRRSWVDSVQPQDTLRLDEVYAQMPTEVQRAALSMAVSDAQSLLTRVHNYSDDVEYRKQTTARYVIEYHRKYALSLACLVFFLIGAPLGAIIRKGGLGVPVIISVLFFLVYYVVSITGEKFVRGLIMDPISGMWGSTFILLPVAVFLIYKATTDSVLLNADWYWGRFRKLSQRLGLDRLRESLRARRGMNQRR